MHASRKCVMCATGTLLQSRTDILLLRTNMAALRRGAVCLNFLRSTSSVLINGRKPAIHRLGRWTDVVRTNMVSLSVGSGLCAAVPFTQTTLALVDVVTEYSKAVHTLTALHRRFLASLGRLTPAEEDSIWQVIISQRAEIGDKMEKCKRYEITWMNAVSLSEMAAEAAYNSGAEEASITARTNLHLAQAQVEETRRLSLDAEKKLAEMKVEEIQRMAEYASFLEGNKEEHEIDEIDEAYQRED